MLQGTLRLALFVAAAALAVSGQSADTILTNGKILTIDSQSSIREAIAIREDRIQAVGTTADIRKLAGPSTRSIDLQGRTVIPGLIDSHLHAIRAALSFSTEVNWIGARSLKEALARISEAARTMKPGAWLIVAGGWNVDQFEDRRRPTQAELIAAAPENPVYVQLGYGWAILTPAGFRALNISTDADLLSAAASNAMQPANLRAASPEARTRSSRFSTACPSRPSSSKWTAPRNSSAS